VNVIEVIGKVGFWMLNNPEQVIYVASAAGSAVAWIKSQSVSKHKNRVDMIKSAAATAGGRILTELVMRPSTEPLWDFVQRRMREEAQKQTQEWSTTGAKVSLDETKMKDMIWGELRQQLPAIVNQMREVQK